MLTAVLPAARRGWGVFVACAVVLSGLVTVAGTTPAHAINAPLSAIASSPSRNGYWLVGRDGGVYSFGDAAFHGSTGGTPPPSPVVGIAPTPDGGGYWLVSSSGGVYSFGNAAFHGSVTWALNQPVVGIAATPSGGGYWLVAADGGLFAFGNAGYFGSMGGTPLNKPISGIAATPSGNGYWMVGQDGGIFAFGDAGYFGSMGGSPLNHPVVGIARTANGGGYWLVGSDGGIFAFGNAGFHGSTGGVVLNQPVVGIAPGPSDAGYWLDATDGGVFAFGSAPFYGSMVSATPPAGNQPSDETTIRNAIVARANGERGKAEVNGQTCYTMNGSCNGLAWCAQFTSWVWIKSGVTDWRWTMSVSTVRSQAQSLGRWRTRTDRPKLGDVAVYKKYNSRGEETISHVNIVVEVRADGWVRTIGGNESNRVVWTDWRNPLTMMSGSLQGYASPVGLDGSVHTASYTAQSVDAAEPDLAVLPDVSVSDATVNESAGTASFTVSLDAARSEPFSIGYSTANGSATAGADYTAASGTVSFAAYEGSKTVTVPILQDTRYERNETFTLNLAASSTLNVVDGTGLGTIVNDDAKPVIAAGDAAVEEGDSGSRTVWFPVTLSTVSDVTATVAWAVTHSTTATGDVTLASGTATIQAGALATRVSTTVPGDVLDEANENALVTLSNPVDATLGRSAGNLTVLDDDPNAGLLRVSVGNGGVTEGASGSRAATFAVSLSAAAPVSVTVSYATSGGSATSGTDFTAKSGSVTIPAGSLSALVTVNVTGDTTVEVAETFSVTLSGATGATLGRSVGTGTIRNDD